jgi:hypothetical protein
MSTERDFDRLANAWMAEGPEELADRVFESAMEDIHRVQGARRARRARPVLRSFRTRWLDRVGPLRFAAATAGVAAVAGLAVLALAVIVGGGHSEVAHPTSPRPSPTPRPQVPLSERFVSTVNRFSISYPDGWTVKPATRTFDFGMDLSLEGPMVDVIAAPDGRTALYAVSQVWPDGMARSAWEQAHRQLQPTGPTDCLLGIADSAQSRDIRVTVDGIPGPVGPGCWGLQNLTEKGRRGYQFLLYPSPVGSGSEEEKANRDLLISMLGSVTLSP